MERLASPANLNNLSYRLWSRYDWDDLFGVVMGSAMISGIGGVLAIGLTEASLFFLGIFIIPLIWFLSIALFFRDTRSFQTSRYHSEDNSLYSRGLSAYYALYQTDIMEKGKELLQNIWDHEVSLQRAWKDHTQNTCKICYKRVELIWQLADVQHVPETHLDDIESISSFIEARGRIKELM